MKRYFLITLVLAVCTTALHAQSTNFGIKAGGNLMMAGKFDIAGTDYTSKWLPGYQAGFFAEIPLGGDFTFMPEVMYSRKAGKFDETIAGNSGMLETRAGYIDVPILFAYNTSPGFHFIIGPQVSFFTDQETKISVNGSVISTTDDGDDFRKSIAGGVFGVGYRLTNALTINGRYNMDFQTFSNDDVDQDKARWGGFALSLGYRFGY